MRVIGSLPKDFGMNGNVVGLPQNGGVPTHGEVIFAKVIEVEVAIEGWCIRNELAWFLNAFYFY